MTEHERGRVRVEPGRKRVRNLLDGQTVADTTQVALVWERPFYPTYYFPTRDVRMELLKATGEVQHSPSRGDAVAYDLVVGDHRVENAAYAYPDSPFEELRDLVAFRWGALDHWFEEDEEVYVHARDPYTRVDVLPSSRHVRVEVDGVILAESSHPTLLFETNLPVRYYFPKTDVRFDLLTPTDNVTACPYKGRARYWSAHVNGTTHDDLVWGYDFPLPESIRVAGLVAFYNERIDLYVDGELQEPPRRR